jgi:hypothetical protein
LICSLRRVFPPCQFRLIINICEMSSQKIEVVLDFLHKGVMSEKQIKTSWKAIEKAILSVEPEKSIKNKKATDR